MGSKDEMVYKHSDKDGHFRRKPSQFRNWVSADPNADFPAEKDRYVLYLNFGCPWAHRTNIVRSLKGLEDIIQLVVMGFELTPEGWIYDGLYGSAPKDPLYGFTKHSQLYFKADPNYEGRYLVPVLWDKKKETIVNNESSEIIRMLYTAFDDLLPEHLREASRPLLPAAHKADIEAMNEWVYDTVNNGVYKCGFATTQEAYDANVGPLFQSLDRLERHLAASGSRFLFGDAVTEADVRLFPTIVRFDTAYYTIFRCNLRMIRHDYPHLDLWLRRLYWDKGDATNGGAFHDTTHFGPIRSGYAKATKSPVTPAGPELPILPLKDHEK